MSDQAGPNPVTQTINTEEEEMKTSLRSLTESSGTKRLSFSEVTVERRGRRSVRSVRSGIPAAGPGLWGNHLSVCGILVSPGFPVEGV